MNRFRAWIPFLVVFGATSLLWGQQRVIPHLVRSGSGFEHTLLFNNHSQIAKTLYLQPYEQDGTTLTPVRVDLKPLQVIKIDPDHILDKSASHLTLAGSSRIGISLAIQSQAQNNGTSVVAHEMTASAREYHLDPLSQGGNPDMWEGFAVVNLGRGATPIVVRRLGYEGGTQQQTERQLQPMSKGVYLFSDLFPSPADSDFYYRVSASEPIALVILGGTRDQRHLWQVAPTAMTDYEDIAFTDTPVTQVPSSPFVVERAYIDEELLTLDLVYPEICEHTTSLLMADGAFLESIPIQANLAIAYNVPPDTICLTAIEQETLTFDLSEMAKQYEQFYGAEGEIILNLFDHSGALYQKLIFSPFFP